jgi:PEGA domain
MTALEELKRLDADVNSVTRFSDLKPVFARLEEIERENPGDFEIQLAISDLKQRLFSKGRLLREQEKGKGPARARVPVPVKVHLPPPPAKLSSSQMWKKAIGVGALIGLIGTTLLWVGLVQIARKKNPDNVLTTGNFIPVSIRTTPPGASIQINNEPKCTSDCRVTLPPGNYQVTALLEGFDPLATGLTVVPGAPINVILNLQSQAQAVRILTDLESGRVILDGQPAGRVQEGQLVLDHVKNGKHSVQIVGPTGETGFSFDLAAGKAPVIHGPIAARDLVTVLVSSFANQATVQTNSPQKISLDSQPQGETGPNGLELKNVTPGNHDLAVGEGPDQKKMVVTFGPAPMLTAFVKSDVNSGTIVVVTGEDGASVFVNGKEQKRKTQRGQLRILAMGNVSVHVAKEGFQPVTDRTAAIAKGEEKRIEFKLVPLPQVAALQVHGAAPGTGVLLGDRQLGVVGPDGSLSAGNIPPGEHSIGLRREGFANKHVVKTFKAGEAVVLTGADLAMVATTGVIRLALNPGDAQVTYRHSDETQSHPVRDPNLKLESGSYVFTAKAPGFTDKVERIQLAAGETRTVELTLLKPPPPPAPKAPAGGVDWSRSGWAQEDGAWVRKGGNFVVIKSGSVNGTISFTAQLKKGGGFLRGAGKIRWFVDFTNSKNYAVFELDKKNFQAKDVREGRAFDRERTQHNGGELKAVDIQVEVAGDRVTNRMKVGQQWIVLDSWTQPGRDFTDGKFGFLVTGNDEIGIANFRYTPR